MRFNVCGADNHSIRDCKSLIYSNPNRSQFQQGITSVNIVKSTRQKGRIVGVNNFKKRLHPLNLPFFYHKCFLHISKRMLLIMVSRISNMVMRIFAFPSPPVAVCCFSSQATPRRRKYFLVYNLTKTNSLSFTGSLIKVDYSLMSFLDTCSPISIIVAKELQAILCKSHLKNKPLILPDGFDFRTPYINP